LAGLGCGGARPARYGSHRRTPPGGTIPLCFHATRKDPMYSCPMYIWAKASGMLMHRNSLHAWSNLDRLKYLSCMMCIFRWHDARAAESLEIHDWWTESVSLQLLARNSKVIRWSKLVEQCIAEIFTCVRRVAATMASGGGGEETARTLSAGALIYRV
jgi:hypothetical protein